MMGEVFFATGGVRIHLGVSDIYYHYMLGTTLAHVLFKKLRDLFSAS